MTIKKLSEKICALVKEENANGVILLNRDSEIAIDFLNTAYGIGFLLGTAAAQHDCKDIDGEGFEDFRRGIDDGFEKTMERFENERD